MADVISGVMMIGSATLRLTHRNGPVVVCQNGPGSKEHFALPGGKAAAFNWVERHLPEFEQAAGNRVIDFYVEIARASAL